TTLRKSTWWRSSSRTANTWMRNRARSRSNEPTRLTKPRASAAWGETSTHERSRPRLDDALSHRGRDHDGVPDRLHADGARDVLRLHRVLRARPGLPRQQS